MICSLKKQVHQKDKYFLPDVREMEEKNLRFFSSISRTSGKKYLSFFSESLGWLIITTVNHSSNVAL